MTRVVIRNKYWQQNTVQEQITVCTADLSHDYTKLIQLSPLGNTHTDKNYNNQFSR